MTKNAPSELRVFHEEEVNQMPVKIGGENKQDLDVPSELRGA
jgi:hypothetical protein